MLCGGRHLEKSTHATREQPPRARIRESPSSKEDSAQPEINTVFKKIKSMPQKKKHRQHTAARILSREDGSAGTKRRPHPPSAPTRHTHTPAKHTHTPTHPLSTPTHPSAPTHPPSTPAHPPSTPTHPHTRQAHPHTRQAHPHTHQAHPPSAPTHPPSTPAKRQGCFHLTDDTAEVPQSYALSCVSSKPQPSLSATTLPPWTQCPPCVKWGEARGSPPEEQTG